MTPDPATRAREIVERWESEWTWLGRSPRSKQELIDAIAAALAERAAALAEARREVQALYAANEEAQIQRVRESHANTDLARSNRDLDQHLAEARRENAGLKESLARSLADALEDEQLHDLTRQREMPWIRRWQQETGTGDLVYPDYGAILAWIMASPRSTWQSKTA